MTSDIGMGMQCGPVEGFTQQVSLYWNEQLLMYLHEKTLQERHQAFFRISRQRYHKTVNCALHNMPTSIAIHLMLLLS